MSQPNPLFQAIAVELEETTRNMTEVLGRGQRRPRLPIRAIHFAPLFALLALLAWAVASPIGAAPDDDYHLTSIWCADGGSAQCMPGSSPDSRAVATGLGGASCYAQIEVQSAACQEDLRTAWDDRLSETRRGNFHGEYPPLFYATMHVFAGSDLQAAALVMRAVNATLFVGLVTVLVALLPATRRRALLWAWLVTLIPLGMFLIPSNNPSGWAITGVGTAFFALLGWFETEGRRRWVLGAIYLVGILMAGGARGDAAVYAAGATITAAILTSERTRAWATRSILPLVGLIASVVLFLSAGQSGVGAAGFAGGGGETDAAGDPSVPLSGLSLAAYNLLSLPSLWTGVWGSWNLGWLDTDLPSIVPWAAVAAFVVVGFAGIARLTVRKAIAASGVLLVLVLLPVYVLTAGGDKVGVALQPRYLFPLIVLFAFVLMTEARGFDSIRFTRVQTFVIFAALTIANLVALQVNIRRYVTGADQQSLDLDRGAEWWWAGVPLGPTAVWAIGSLALAGLLAVLWPLLRQPAVSPRIPELDTAKLLEGARYGRIVSKKTRASRTRVTAARVTERREAPQ